jgi:hypothetical protein
VHQKSGAGLRIEYTFINQSKQRIEKSCHVHLFSIADVLNFLEYLK